MKIVPYLNQRTNRLGTIKPATGFQRGFLDNHETSERSDASILGKLSFGGLVHFLLGVSLFIPGFAIISVGRTTGLQSALFLFGICGILRAVKGQFRMDRPVIYLLALWALCLVISVANEGFRSTQIHAMIVFDTALMILGIFCLIGKVPKSFDQSLVRGIFAGAVASSIYALYQQAAFRFGLPYGVPRFNNHSFSLITDSPDFGARSFACFPEPSMLAAYLIPIAMSLLFLASRQRSAKAVYFWLMAAVTCCGILASGSFSVFVSMPIALLGCLFIQKWHFKTLIKAVFTLLSIGMIILLLIASFAWATELKDILADRLSAVSDDASLVTRYGMKIASIKIFSENPLFGSGVNPDADYFYASLPIEATVYQSQNDLTGGDSLPLIILSGQGIFGFGCFAAFLYMALTRSRRNKMLQIFLIGLVVVMSLQCGNVDLYLLWVMIGLCLAQAPNLRTAPLNGRQIRKIQTIPTMSK